MCYFITLDFPLTPLCKSHWRVTMEPAQLLGKARPSIAFTHTTIGQASMLTQDNVTRFVQVLSPNLNHSRSMPNPNQSSCFVGGGAFPRSYVGSIITPHWQLLLRLLSQPCLMKTVQHIEFKTVILLHVELKCAWIYVNKKKMLCIQHQQLYWRKCCMCPQ